MKEEKEYSIVAKGDVALFYKDNDDVLFQRLMEVQEKVDKIWMHALHQKKLALHNGSLLNLIHIMKERGRTKIIGVYIEYKYFYAQHVCSELELGITPIGVSGLTCFLDEGKEYAICATRCNTTEYDGYLEFVPSGSIDKKYKKENMRIDYYAQLFSELYEETGIQQKNIEKVHTLGCVFDKKDKVYDICVKMDTQKDKEEIFSLMKNSCEYNMPVAISLELEEGMDLPFVPTSNALRELYKMR